MTMNQLSLAEIIQLQRYNTPTIYNGWEAITQHDRCSSFNLEPTIDHMPQLGSIVGYAVTVKIQPSNPNHPKDNPEAWQQYRSYIASIPGPKIVIVQDMDKPVCYGSFWGEVNSSIHKAIGCVGTITDGAVRDLNEMARVGFKAISRSLCVGHAFSWPVTWNCTVEVFGKSIEPGNIIHADTHGFIVIPQEDVLKLLESVRFMDDNECSTVIPAATGFSGKSHTEILEEFQIAGENFSEHVRHRF